MIQLVGEHGYRGVSIGLLTERAHVSRRTFYECYTNLEECLEAVIDEGSEHTIGVIVDAFQRQTCWRDAVRAALADLLDFYDTHPLHARVWIVEIVAAGSFALEHRERSLARLRARVSSLAPIPTDGDPSPLLFESQLAGLLGVLQARVTTNDPQPLVELLGPLMGLIAQAYLDEGAVAQEIEQGERLAREILAKREHAKGEVASWQASGQGWVDAHGRLPAALANASAARARACVQFVAANPEANNRQIALGIGVPHQGQASALLDRLLRAGLLFKRPGEPGKSNAWRVSPEGERAMQTLEELAESGVQGVNEVRKRYPL
jgi:AcrR family transcriptional regulator